MKQPTRIIYKESIAQSIISDLSTFGFMSIAAWFSKGSAIWSTIAALFFLFFVVIKAKQFTKSSNVLYFYSHDELKEWVDKQGDSK